MGVGGGGGFSVEASLSQLTKQNAKLERMLGKIGTLADTRDFRDLLSSERASATKLHVAALAHMKANKTKAQTVARFEQEYKRFAVVIKKIDAQQKKQIVAMSYKQEPNAYADEIQAEAAQEGDADGFGPSSFAQEQLQNIEFLEYQTDEILTRRGQIRAIEKDIREVAEMYKDLQTMSVNARSFAGPLASSRFCRAIRSWMDSSLLLSLSPCLCFVSPSGLMSNKCTSMSSMQTSHKRRRKLRRVKRNSRRYVNSQAESGQERRDPVAVQARWRRAGGAAQCAAFH